MQFVIIVPFFIVAYTDYKYKGPCVMTTQCPQQRCGQKGQLAKLWSQSGNLTDKSNLVTIIQQNPQSCRYPHNGASNPNRNHIRPDIGGRVHEIDKTAR